MTKLIHPLPRPLDGPIRSEGKTAVHRRFSCPYYATCLDESVRNSWESFTCLHCPLQSMYADAREDVELYAHRRTGSPTTGE
jgi:hypothetical protein